MADTSWNDDPVAALAEAERRIEETGAGWWYGEKPYVTALERLPRNLGKLSPEHVDVSSTNVTGLSGLAAKPELKGLVLNDRVFDLSELVRTPLLERLVAYKAPVRDLSPLRRCGSLTSVQLDVAEVDDLSPLAELPKLEDLQLWGYRGQPLWPHAGVRRLSLIRSAESSVDLSPLATWSRLTSLSCGDGAYAAPLPTLPTVEFLAIPGCGDDVFRALAGFAALQSLHAYDGRVSDLSPLTGCEALETVSLSNNPIRDVTPLLDKPFLSDIHISGTEVSEIAALSWSPALRTLGADRTLVKSLEGWNPDSPVQRLKLADTEVSDLSPLRGSALRSLNIARTRVSDLNFLDALPGLTALDLNGAPVDDLAPILRHQTLLYVVSNLDYRDRLGHWLDFQNTPAAGRDPAIAAISLLDGDAHHGLRQAALRKLAGLATAGGDHQTGSHAVTDPANGREGRGRSMFARLWRR